MFKMALFDCAIEEKCCGGDGGRGICPLFSSPPQGIWQLMSPHTREFTIQGKKNANARGPSRGRDFWDFDLSAQKRIRHHDLAKITTNEELQTNIEG